MKEFINIDGYNFELVKQSIDPILVNQFRKYGYSNIWMAYGKPSETKVDIWNHWHSVLVLMGCKNHNIFVESRNCFKFTISAILETEKGNYFIHITPEHKYIRLIKNDVFPVPTMM